jgi:hypothetical protein
MRHIALAIFIAGVACSTSAFATSNQDDRQRDAAVNSQSSGSASEDRAAPEYVQSECDVRRPSCRRWRALADERLDKSKDDTDRGSSLY